MRHASEPPRPLKEINAGVPDGLQQIMDWMLAKEAGKRYPVPDRAAQALSLFLAAEGDPAPPADAEPHLRSYLTWLEMNVDEAAARGVRDRPSRRKKGKRKTLIALPAPPVEPSAEAKPGEPAADLGVELVPAATTDSPQCQEGSRWFGLQRRDFLMMGIGAAAGVLAVLGAIGVGWLVARIRSRE